LNNDKITGSDNPSPGKSGHTPTRTNQTEHSNVILLSQRVQLIKGIAYNCGVFCDLGFCNITGKVLQFLPGIVAATLNR